MIKISCLYEKRSSHRRCSVRKGVLKNFTKVYGKLPVPESQACNFIKKEALAYLFSCEFCEISKNTFFTKHFWTTASKFVTEMLIFRTSCSQLFFKIDVLKNFAILELFLIVKLQTFFEHLRWLLLNLRDSKYFLAADSRTGFYSGFLWKHDLINLRSSDWRCSVKLVF